MKRVLIIILTLLNVVVLYATQYIVTANLLNLRTEPSTTATIATTAVKGESLNVVEINGDWAYIEKDGNTYYGAVQYLSKLEDKQLESADVAIKNNFTNAVLPFNVPDSWRFHSDIPLFIGIFILAYFLIIHFFCNKYVYEDNKNLFTGSSVAFIALCLLEIWHFLCYADDPTWFCSGKAGGWIWLIVNFILFGLFCYIQIITFVKLTSAFHYHGNRHFNNTSGYILSLLAMIAYGLSCFYFKEYTVVVISIGIFILTLWFIWMFMCNSRDEGSVPNFLMLIAFWVIGAIGSFVILTHFVVFAFLVIIAILAFKFVSSEGKNQESSKSKSFFNIFEEPDNRIARDNYNNNEKNIGELEDSEGHRIEVTFLDGGYEAVANDWSGRKFKKKISGDFEEYV